MGTYTQAQLTTELNRIKTATSACRDAIYNKGVTSIPADASLGSLAAYANMIQCEHPDILLSYIANSNTNATSSSDIADVYFDTGYHASAYTEFSGVFSMPSNNSDGMLFGAWDSNHFWFIPYYNGGKFYYKNSLNTSSDWIESGTPAGAGNFVYTAGSLSIYNNSGVEVIRINSENRTRTRVTPTSTTTISPTVSLFARHGTSDAYDCKAIKGTKIKYLCLYDKAVLVRFYIPVLHWYNGEYVACFYDKVNDNYIYNLGSDPVYYESTGYTVLDYIKVTSASTNGFSTQQVITSFDRLHTRYLSKAQGNGNMEGLIAKYVSSSIKTGIWSKYAGSTTDFSMYPGRLFSNNSSGATASFGSDYNYSLDKDNIIFSSYQTIVSNAWRPTISVNGIVNLATSSMVSTSAYGGNPYILLYAARKDATMHYAVLSNDYMGNEHSYIPLLINNTPVFYDVETGWTTTQSSGTVSYEILN